MMSSIERHPPGAFCWIELGTPDLEGAKDFYRNLFGWKASDFRLSSDEIYTTFDLEGCKVAAAYQLRPDEGLPPHWLLYVAVASADRAAHRVRELGGEVSRGPFTVGAFGRMAVIRDPAGAVFSVWQGAEHQGLEIGGEENTFCWADLSTPEPEAARTFYEGLFDWTIGREQHDKSGYWTIRHEHAFSGGITPVELQAPDTAPHWLIYFLTTDLDSLAERAKRAGAHLQVPPMSMPNAGRMAVLTDPQGANFALYQSLDAA